MIKVKEFILKFLWDHKPPKIENDFITNPIEKGGLRFPNIDLLVKPQKAAWVKRMVENKEAVWMQLFHNTLPYMNLIHLLKCSIDVSIFLMTYLAFIIRCYMHGMS